MVSFAPEHPAPLNPFLFLLGSVFPDCDHKHAPIGRWFPMWLFFKHRGFTHTVWGMVFFSGIVFGLGFWFFTTFDYLNWAISFFLGCLLHLGLDSSTPMGINWWGRKRKRAYVR